MQEKAPLQKSNKTVLPKTPLLPYKSGTNLKMESFMIRAFVSVSVLLLTFASAAFAGENCEKLVMSCSATFHAYDGAAEVDRSEEVNFANEAWDEPSMANCAATVYLNRGNTTVRFYATKDLNSDIVTVSATASQLEEGAAGRTAKYSNTASSYATLGMIQNMGSLSLPTPIMMGDSMVKTVYVGCKTK